MAAEPAIEFPVGGIDDGELRLRFPAESDRDWIAEACRDDAIRRYTRVPDEYTLEDADEWIAGDVDRSSFPLVLAGADDDRPLGTLGLVEFSLDDRRCELGYWTAPWARRQGMMARAIPFFCGWLFEELGMVRIEAGIEPDNVGSRALIERCGFTYEGTLRSFMVIKGTRRDLCAYSLLRGELADPV